MADGKVVIDTSLDNSGLKNGISNLNKSFAGLKSSLGKIGAAVGVAFGTAALISFGRQCINLGSNIDEVQNVVDVAFGNMSYKIEEFAQTSIENFGMSRLSAKKTASTYMAMARSMGVSEETASDMSVTLTGLTGDVASFYNISQELADIKLKSVFTGETETLKDLGIVMTQTNLQAFALSSGINKNIADMTQAELVGLRYNYVLKQLELANGDFARTQGSWANQTRILSENWKELMSVLGQGLIQILTPVLRVLNKIVESLINAANTASAAMSRLLGTSETQITSVGSAANQVNAAIEETAQSAGTLADNTKSAGKAADNAVMGFDALNVLSSKEESGSLSSSAAPGVITANVETAAAKAQTEGFIAQTQNAFSKLGKYINEKLTPAVNAWGKAFAKLEKPVKTAADKIKKSTADLLNNSLKPLAAYITQQFVPNIVNSASVNLAPVFSDILGLAVSEFANDYEFMCGGISAATNDILMPAVKLYEKTSTDIFDSIGRAWNEHGTTLTEGFATFKESLRSIWNDIYNRILKPVFDKVFAVVGELWDKHLKPLWDNLIELLASVGEFLLMIWNKYLAPFVTYIVELASPLIRGAVNAVLEIIGTAAGMVADVVGNIVSSLTGLIDFLNGAFSGNWKKAWNGIKDFVGGIWDSIWGIIKGSINLIIGGLNTLWKAVYKVFAGIANGIGGAVGWIGDLIGKDWSFSMPSQPPLIPKLAKGAVIPANREFLAVLGDQTRGTNIETPLETMIQAFEAALSNGGYGATADVHFTVELDGDVLYKAVKRAEAKRVNVYSNPAFVR